jgi:hypothetical protein
LQNVESLLEQSFGRSDIGALAKEAVQDRDRDRYIVYTMSMLLPLRGDDRGQYVWGVRVWVGY